MKWPTIRLIVATALAVCIHILIRDQFSSQPDLNITAQVVETEDGRMRYDIEIANTGDAQAREISFPVQTRLPIIKQTDAFTSSTVLTSSGYPIKMVEGGIGSTNVTIQMQALDMHETRTVYLFCAAPGRLLEDGFLHRVAVKPIGSKGKPPKVRFDQEVTLSQELAVDYEVYLRNGSPGIHAGPVKIAAILPEPLDDVVVRYGNLPFHITYQSEDKRQIAGVVHGMSGGKTTMFTLRSVTPNVIQRAYEEKITYTWGGAEGESNFTLFHAAIAGLVVGFLLNKILER